MINVLVAEDIDILRRRIVRALDNTEDIKVVAAVSTGKSAVQAARVTDFHIALLDVEMERIDSGIVAAKEIIGLKPNVDIIFLTLHESDEIIFNAFGSGAVDYIIKTEDIDPVIEHIRNVYNNKAMLDWEIQSRIQKEFRRLQRSENELRFFIHKIAILTPAEKELLRLLVGGNSLKQITKIRFVELSTIKTQISHILKKLEVGRTRDIVKQIREMNLENLLDDISKV